MNRNLFLLGLVFFFTFFGYSSVQQFVTSYFIDNGNGNLGFYSLILVYGGFMLGNLFLVGIIQKIGAKKSMYLAIFFYALYIFSLLIPNIYLICSTSFLLGISASFLWIGQQSYIIQLSKDKNIGNNFSVVNIFLFLGASLGAIILGKLIIMFGYKESFFIFGLFPVIAIIISFFLDDLKENSNRIKNKNSLFSVFQCFKNLDLLKLGIFYCSLSFTTGLFFSIVPIHIKEVFGISYIGIIVFIFYLLVMFFLFFSGKIVDKYNNKNLIIITHIIGLISMILLYFYNEIENIIYIGIFVLAIGYSLLPPMIGSIISKLSRKDNLEIISSFFFIFSNIGIILGIIISSFINSKIIYIISFVFITITLISYLTLYKKSFSKIKKGIN